MLMPHELSFYFKTPNDDPQLVTAGIVAIADGRVALVAPSIPEADAARVIDVAGKMVTPGLIDVHAHVYQPKKNPAHPDSAGVWGGVTTVADVLMVLDH